MVVMIAPFLVTTLRFLEMKLLHDSRVSQNTQGPIHRPQADLREDPARGLVNLVRGRMSVPLAHGVEYNFPLSRETEAASRKPRGYLRIGESPLCVHVRVFGGSGLEPKLQRITAQEVIQMVRPVLHS